MADLRFLQLEYDNAYKKAIDSYQSGDLDMAKRNFALAAKAMYQMGDESDGELKEERYKKAAKIAEAAQKIKPIVRETPSLKSGDARSVTPRNDDDDPRNDDDQKYLNQWEPSKQKGVKLSDVAGLEEAKKELFDKVINPQKHPEIYAKYKREAGGGILLYGLPGTGKTMFAKAVATELNAAFFSVDCKSWGSRYFGDAEKNIDGLFQAARKYPYSVIFFDEFEAIGAKRDSKSTVMKRVIPQLLTEIQGFDKNESKILIIAATNRPWDIDSAFLRPGRFDTRIYVPLPDEAARLIIAKKAFENVPLSSDFSFEVIVAKTEGFSGADVENLCQRAKDPAILRETNQEGKEYYVTNADVEAVASHLHSSVQKEDIENLEKFQCGDAIEGE